jgi:UDP-2,3-diacylglucosamine hydrolase
MSDVLFISDLHLSEDTTRLNQLFSRFLVEKAAFCDSLYILGDFFDYWVGDDLSTPWANDLAGELKKISAKGVKLFFLPGNRDFLVGQAYLQKAGLTLLPDPTLITLGNNKVLLKHGDDLCSLDKRHQVFRAITRTRLIKRLFLSLSAKKREKIALFLRQNSGAKHLPMAKMRPQKAAIVKELQRGGAKTMIHGHTHRHMIELYTESSHQLQHIVLPDWGKDWGYLCYNQTNGFQLKLNKQE